MGAQDRIQQAADTLHGVLVEIGWEPEQVENDSIYSVDFGPPHVPVSSAVAAIVRPDEVLTVHFNLGVIAPPERRDEVATMLALVNEELLVGSYVMDYDDGHVGYKISVPFAGEPLPEATVRNTIAAGMAAVERFAHAVVDVIQEADPHDAFQSAIE